MRPPLRSCLPILLLAVSPAAAAQMLPAGACAADGLFAHGLEAHEAPDPSGGGGGATGDVAATVLVPSTGLTRPYHLRVPPQYDAQRAWPLLLVLHGSPGSPALADAAARAVRDDWRALADAQGVIVLAPVASGPSAGGWNPPADSAAIAAMRAEVEARYNIDRRRRLLWGWSAGGHYGHGLALAAANDWAAYAVNAGVLQAFAGIGAPAAATRRIPLSIRVGDADPLAPFARDDVARFTAAGWIVDAEVRFEAFAGGHAYAPADLLAHWAFLCRWARP